LIDNADIVREAMLQQQSSVNAALDTG